MLPFGKDPDDWTTGELEQFSQVMRAASGRQAPSMGGSAQQSRYGAGPPPRMAGPFGGPPPGMPGSFGGPAPQMPNPFGASPGPRMPGYFGGPDPRMPGSFGGPDSRMAMMMDSSRRSSRMPGTGGFGNGPAMNAPGGASPFGMDNGLGASRGEPVFSIPGQDIYPGANQVPGLGTIVVRPGSGGTIVYGPSSIAIPGLPHGMIYVPVESLGER